MSEPLINSLVTLASLGGAWAFFFWLYRDYRLDKFRESTFALRDELFDLANCGQIEFDHPTYGMLRSMINGSIQFGHRLGLLGLITFFLVRREDEYQSGCVKFEEKWQTSLENLSPEAKEKVEKIRSKLHVILFEQVVLTSILLVCTVFSIVAVSILKHLSTNATKGLMRLLPCDVNSLAGRYDAAALSMGS